MKLKYTLLTLLVTAGTDFHSQVANYVNNGGFEILVSNTITSGGFDKVNSWGPIDSSLTAYYFFSTVPSIANAPYCSTGFQCPHSGHNFILSQFFCDLCPREYPRNRLKQMLKPSKVYCAKYHIVNTNNNRVAIDKYGMYFGDATLDTISKCMDPITYLNPQVENQNGIITDTLNWIAVSGTFVATGTEKYCVLGNFRTNVTTNTLLLQPALPSNSNDVYIDDVSLIELELPAYAGPDTYVLAGDSVYIGRESDVEIDESCIWYRMTSPTTSVPIDTLAGIWVKPAVTSTYVVRQQLWCSGVKWDTVVVSLSGVGLHEIEMISNSIKLFPNPASDLLQIQCNSDVPPNVVSLSIYNHLGQMIREEEIMFKNKSASLSSSDLPDGVYAIELITTSGQHIKKRFVIAR